MFAKELEQAQKAYAGLDLQAAVSPRLKEGLEEGWEEEKELRGGGGEGGERWRIRPDTLELDGWSQYYHLRLPPSPPARLRETRSEAGRSNLLLWCFVRQKERDSPGWGCLLLSGDHRFCCQRGGGITSNDELFTHRDKSKLI